VGHPGALSASVRSASIETTCSWRRRNTSKLEFAQEVVILCHGALALEDLDRDNGLVVLGRGQNQAVKRHKALKSQDIEIKNLTAAVEKIWLFCVGMFVLRGISFVITPPVVSMPSVKGLTSMRRIRLAMSTPERTAP
jgi:hypothetical protein